MTVMEEPWSHDSSLAHGKDPGFRVYSGSASVTSGAVGM